MKRSIILLSLMAGLAFSGFAQRDTVGAGYPYYYPTFIDFDTMPHTSPMGRPFCYGTGSLSILNLPFVDILNYIAIKFVPDSSVNIIGIAYGFKYRYAAEYSYNKADTVTQAVTIYRPEGTGLLAIDSVVDVVAIDSVPISTYVQLVHDHDVTRMFNDTSLLKYFDLGQSFRDYYQICVSNWEISPAEYDVNSWYIKESYFEEEIHLSQGDAFYIGASWGSKNRRSEMNIPEYFIGQPEIGYSSDDSIPTYLPPMDFRPIDTNGIWYPDQRTEAVVPLIWAIIRRDCDSCTTVQGLQMFRSSATKAFFRWNQGVNHHDWQLSYGPAGTAPEDGTIVDCSHISSGLIEFDPDSHYVVYVRARCKFARYEYGPWSSPLVFSINGGVVGIDEAEVQDVTLSPNPAADRVTVGCGAAMRHVSVFNAAGVQVHGEAVEGGTTTIDLKGWPAGQYVVKVETAAGTASKVLTVAR